MKSEWKEQTSCFAGQIDIFDNQRSEVPSSEIKVLSTGLGNSDYWSGDIKDMFRNFKETRKLKPEISEIDELADRFVNTLKRIVSNSRMKISEHDIKNFAFNTINVSIIGSFMRKPIHVLFFLAKLPHRQDEILQYFLHLKESNVFELALEMKRKSKLMIHLFDIENMLIFFSAIDYKNAH